MALVVGNGAYLSSGALKNPPRDAHAIAGALRRLGFDDVRERIDLSRADFETELRAFGADAAGADWAVIYYAGHGIEFDGANHVVPVDAAVRTAEAAEDETIALDMLIENVEPAGKLRLIILDACRDNPFAAQSTDKELTRAFGRGLARIEPSNVLVAYAAHHGQVALDGKGDNSPYVEALLEYLPAPGLEISLMFRKVHDRVFERTGDAQEPFTYGSLSGDPLYFKPR